MGERRVNGLAPAQEVEAPMQSQPNAQLPKRVRVAPNLYRRTKDGRFEDIRVSPATGKQHLQTLKARNLTEAKKEQTRLAVKIDDGDAPAPSRLTVGEVAADYFAAAEGRVATGELAQRSLDIYRQQWQSHLEQRLGRMRVQSVQATHIGAVLRELREEGLSSWTVKGVLTTAATIFNHGVGRGWITESPTRRLTKGERPKGRNKKQVRILSPDEAARVIKATTPRWRPLLVTAAHTGARVSELLALQWGDIDWNENELSISRQLGRNGKLKCPKSANGERTISLSAELRLVLREHFIASGQQPGFVFACETGTAPDYASAWKALSLAIKSAGIEYDRETQRLSFHAFRHGAASALIRAGADPVRVARFLGDDVQTILSTYAQEWATAKDDNLGDVLAAALSTG
jgi:integrase